MLQQVEQGEKGLDPQFDVNVEVPSIVLALRRSQMECMLVLGERFSQLTRRTKFGRMRPSDPVQGNARAWWRFAIEASLVGWRERRKEQTWGYISNRRRLRLAYIPLYIEVSGVELQTA